MPEEFMQTVGMPLVAFLVPLIVAAIKKYLDQVPSWALPIIAGPLGYGVDWAVAWLSNYPAMGWKAVIVGLAGVGVREVYDQTKKAITPPTG